MMSSMCSMPIDSLTKSGVKPEAIWSASLICECEVLAGCRIRLFASPTFAKLLKSLMLSTIFTAFSYPPFGPKTSIPPNPFLRYFFAIGYDSSLSSPG